MDDLDRSVVVAGGQEMAAALAIRGLDMVDPVAAAALPPDDDFDANVAHLVRADLNILRRSDALLIDMSLANRIYVGCVCELTYAHTWRIPAVVWVGDTGLERRVWLRYHATAVVRERVEALDVLTAVVAHSPGKLRDMAT
ncbi:hypothetical protein K1W54_12765 [Micromonospora sp. CPCC 205371]|nr:hypothetical protein [Micromonospora sp. CPCC 205371]